ncbi:DUF4349 domain-containing protein [Flavihumibacter petaseus]|uniref:DUF4349 domain-containing protein n=1 Tax=Flavihumibacter petaseus TaxID=549295 RepID=UPI001FDF13FA|nr:DUF4349 domain-containing protein [Flavihumibacter petaseus]
MKNGFNPSATADFSTSQKFEKTASVRTKTSAFEKDETIIKSKTKNYNAVIQYEQNVGQTGNRQIHFLIGVNPEKFDSFYLDIQRIGTVTSKEVTKVDKTNEYRQLNAKKTSIEKSLQALNELKSKGGGIEDFVTLNDKILETEERLQELGVELGNFNAENEFCTVRISLYEGAPASKIGFISRVKVALEWTIRYFALLVTGILLTSVAILVILMIADRLKLITVLINSVKE